MIEKKPGQIAWFLLLAAILSACARTPTPSTLVTTPEVIPSRAPDPTRAVRSEVTILADGQLVAVDPLIPLGFTISGRLLTVAVETGDTVSPGDLLAALDTVGLERQLALARLNLATAEEARGRAERDLSDALVEARISLAKLQVRIEQAEAQDADSSVSVAAIRLRQAETSLADAQTAYNTAWEPARDWELQMTEPTGIAPFQGPSMSDQLKAEREATQRGLTAATDNLTLARIDYNQAITAREAHAFDLQTLAQDLVLAEFQIEKLERGVDATLALNIDKARLEIESLEEQIAEAELSSPWSGLVLSVEALPGALVGAGTPVLTLLNPGELEFHTSNLSERDLPQVEIGRPVRVLLKAYPDQPLTGTIVRIAPQAGPIVGDAATFAVMITLEPAGLDLRPGMTGRAEIASAG